MPRTRRYARTDTLPAICAGIAGAALILSLCWGALAVALATTATTELTYSQFARTW